MQPSVIFSFHIHFLNQMIYHIRSSHDFLLFSQSHGRHLLIQLLLVLYTHHHLL